MTVATKNVSTDLAIRSDMMDWHGGHFDLPGQAAGRTEQISDILVRELMPRDFIERVWIRDLAYLIARIEYIRAIIAGVHAHLIRYMHDKMARDRGPNAFFNQAERAALDASAQRGHQPDECRKAINDDPDFLRLLGLSTLGNISKVTQLEQIAAGLVRDRDRMIQQLDRRRREKAKSLLLALELRPATDES